jgi:hypothetical protein
VGALRRSNRFGQNVRKLISWLDIDDEVVE